MDRSIRLDQQEVENLKKCVNPEDPEEQKVPEKEEQKVPEKEGNKYQYALLLNQNDI